MTTTPCKDCENRQFGCHGKCEKYAAFRAKKEQEAKKRAEDGQLTDLMSRAKTRALKATIWKR